MEGGGSVDFFKYQLLATEGVIASATYNTLYDEQEKCAIVGALDVIKIWNLRSGTVTKTLRDDTDSSRHPVTCLQVNPTNKDIIAAGYEDGAVRLWSVKEGRVLVQFNGHKSAVTAFTFDPYTMRMASGGRDSDIVVWDLVAEQGLFRLQGHTGGISGLQFVCSGQYLVSSGRDSMLKVWDLTAQMAIETEVSHRAEITSFVMSLDERVLMTVGADSLLRLFSVDHESMLKVLSAPTEKLNCLTLIGQVQRASKERATHVALHNQRLLCILSADRSMECFEVRGKEEAKAKLRRKKKNTEDAELSASDLFKQLRVYKLSSKAHSFAISALSTKDELRVLFGFNNNRVEEMSLPTDPMKPVSTINTVDLQGHRAEIRAVAISSDQQLMLSGAPDGCKVWSLLDDSVAFLRSISDDDLVDVNTAAFIGDLHLVVIGTKRGHLILADANTGSVVEAYQAHDGQVMAVDVGSDGRTIATCSSDKTVKFWEVKQKDDKTRLKCVKTLQVQEEALAVRMSRDLRLIAVSTMDMTVKVFFMDSLKIFLTLFGHKLPVTSLDISADCKTLISGSLDKSIKIWGLQFGELRKSILAHAEAVTSVRFILDSTAFASVGRDKQVKTWMASGAFKPLQRSFEKHFGDILCLAVSPSFMVTGSVDKAIRVFRHSDDLLIAEEESEVEADKRLEQSLLDANENDVNQQEPGKLTVESLKSGERVLQAIEAADEERLVRDEARLQGIPHTPTITFSSFAKGQEPHEYVMRTLDRIPAPDLDQSILILPNRMLYSLLLYCQLAMDGTMIGTAASVFNAVMRLFFKEIVADKQLQPVLASIGEKLKERLGQLDSLYLFNMAALQLLQ